MADVRLIHGDCTAILPTLAGGSVDCVITDPPYPCIKRSYGTWTEAEWWELMRAVVPECMRILKPAGSAVFILQPNSERVGRMRTWLWEFMVWVGREWGIVQDVWWWNTTAMPTVGAGKAGLTRPSVKACVWLGPPDCHRNQAAVLWSESEQNRKLRTVGRAWPSVNASGKRNSIGTINQFAARDAAGHRGGVTPFNLIPESAQGRWNGGTHGHGAGTPMLLADWWLRYICPPGGTVLDPFAGSFTTAIAAMRLGLDFMGIEKVPAYVEIGRKRVAEELAKSGESSPLFTEAV